MAVEYKNILLSDVTETLSYKSSSYPVTTRYPQRDNISSHASYVQRKLEQCRQQSYDQKQVAAIKYKKGMYLEFSGESGYELATKSLEDRRQGIRLLNVKDDSDGVVRATVYIPEGKENFFLKKVQAYATETTKNGNPKNNALISSIEDIKLALLESFWMDKEEFLPDREKIRCEIWLRYDVKTRGKNIDTTPWLTVNESFMAICRENEIETDEKSIYFPERIVKRVSANKEQLKILLETCEYITEIRRADEPNRFFEKLTISEQTEWIEELISRCTYQNDNVSICILDAGLNPDHPLLRPAVKSEDCVQSIDPSWGTKDNIAHGGHGTEMAGVALFGNLKNTLAGTTKIEVKAALESVKILPPFGENSSDIYGAITQQAVSLAEIANPSSTRIHCMAVTAQDDNDNDGKPSSWSAAIDDITSGATEEEVKRLFLISAGNVYPSEVQDGSYPDANIIHGVENPGQSWNAITVGGYNSMLEIEDPCFKGFNPVADNRELSPYSATSTSWKNKWPVKPEVLFEAGNMVTNGTDYDSCPDLSLLTTGHTISRNMFSVIWGTSSATAQASNFCAELIAEYPDLWPETIRALMIHSAEWTDKMRSQFCEDESKKKSRRNLLRTCGYGIPNINTAIQCMRNSVNMVIQGSLQPYEKDRMKEMHLHTIPWPKEVLRELGVTPVKLKVTLSYFIEPSPGEVGWKDRYRYPSSGLRFEINNSNQSYDDFKKYVNLKMREENPDDKGDGSSGTSRWYLGPDNRNSGSIHSDYIEASAVDLCDCNYIAVYPIGGWWKERQYLQKHTKRIRYALVVSLSTTETQTDFYTPIMTEINQVISIPV